MNLLQKLARTIRALPACLAYLGSLCFTGCESSGPPRDSMANAPIIAVNAAESRLRIGDQVRVNFDTGGGQATPPQPLDTAIDEKGEISLALAGRVKAEGFTPSELAQRIHELYVPKYYVRCNVTVMVSQRFFYIGGEVNNRGRIAWVEDMTVVKAIQMAGSFTEYANRNKVEVTRGTKRWVVNAEDARRNPSKDLFLQPGDSVWVPRSIW